VTAKNNLEENIKARQCNPFSCFIYELRCNHDGENFKQTDEIQRNIILNLHVLFRPNKYFSMMSACHTINSAELQDGKPKINCKGLNKSDRGLICGIVPAIV
jgi:hypothetical protein